MSEFIKKNAPLFQEFMVTARELEIMLLIIQGYSNSRISSALTISDSTTKRHIYNLFKKLDINSRFELVTWINERAVAQQ